MAIQIPTTMAVIDTMITVVSIDGHRRARVSSMGSPSMRMILFIAADSKIASRAPAMALNPPVANGAAESRSEPFFCVSKNLHTRKSLRPFVPFLEVAQVLQIAGSVSSPEDAAQAANDWRPQRGYSTHTPNLTTKKVDKKSPPNALVVTAVIVELK